MEEMEQALTRDELDERAREIGEMLNEGSINLYQSEIIGDIVHSHRLQADEIERLRNIAEIVLYHHPSVDDPIDYEATYDDLKKRISAEYEKNPWLGDE